jgi:hypothetical protein
MVRFQLSLGDRGWLGYLGASSPTEKNNMSMRDLVGRRFVAFLGSTDEY